MKKEHLLLIGAGVLAIYLWKKNETKKAAAAAAVAGAEGEAEMSNAAGWNVAYKGTPRQSCTYCDSTGHCQSRPCSQMPRTASGGGRRRVARRATMR